LGIREDLGVFITFGSQESNTWNWQVLSKAKIHPTLVKTSDTPRHLRFNGSDNSNKCTSLEHFSEQKA
jgi:hypothetical protein